jgi:phage gpG-like protein
MRIDIDLFGDVQVSRELLRFAGRIEDATPAFEQIANDLRELEAQQFDEQGKRASGGWQQLADSTIDRKLHSSDPRVRANANVILQATGRLKASLTGEWDPDHIEIVQPHQLVFGTTVPYAHYHQLGEGVPRRRELELTETDRRQVVRTLQAYLVDATRE